jgi:hypothetical protein
VSRAWKEQNLRRIVKQSRNAKMNKFDESQSVGWNRKLLFPSDYRFIRFVNLKWINTWVICIWKLSNWSSTKRLEWLNHVDFDQIYVPDCSCPSSSSSFSIYLKLLKTKNIQTMMLPILHVNSIFQIQAEKSIHSISWQTI